MSRIEIESQQEKLWSEWYLVIQGAFYFAQGIAFAALLLLPVIMSDYLANPTTPEQAVSYQSIIMIPWYIKLVYGLLSDNVSFGKFGRRRPYILIAGGLGIIGWFAITAFNTFSVWFIVVGIVLSLSIALSDAIIDSFAVDITPKKRRGWMQGVGWGGRGAGTALAGIIFYLILDKVPWTVAFYIAGGLLVVTCIIAALFYKEPPIFDFETHGRVKWVDYKKEITRKETWIVTLFMLLSGAGIAIISTFTTFLNVQTSVNLDDIGLGITFFALGQFVGAALIGILGDLLPLLPVLLSSTALYVGGILSLIFIPYSNLTIIYLIVGIIGAINGGYEATQMRIGMEYSQGPIGGSLYNWYMSISNVGQITLGSIVIAQLAGPLGGFEFSMQAASVFLLLALIPAIFLIIWLRKREQEPEVTEEEELSPEKEAVV